MLKPCGFVPMLFCLLFLPVTHAENQKIAVSGDDLKKLALAIEDEIYDFGYQGYDFGYVGRTLPNRDQEIRIFVRPYLEQGKNMGEVGKGLGLVIYKLMPFGEVFRLFSIEANGLVIVYGNPESGFPPQRPNYLTVYMDDDELCQFKHDWLKSSYVIRLQPGEPRLREAATRQKKRIGHSVREDPSWRTVPEGHDPRCGEGVAQKRRQRGIKHRPAA